MSCVLLVVGGNLSDWLIFELVMYDYFVGIDCGCFYLLEVDLLL